MARKNAYTGQPTTTAAAIFTASGPVTITSATVVDAGGSGDTLSFWLVPSAGSAVDANLLIKAQAVTAGETGRVVSELTGKTLDDGDRLFCQATAGSQVTLDVSVEGSTT